MGGGGREKEEMTLANCQDCDRLGDKATLEQVIIHISMVDVRGPSDPLSEGPL